MSLATKKRKLVTLHQYFDENPDPNAHNAGSTAFDAREENLHPKIQKILSEKGAEMINFAILDPRLQQEPFERTATVLDPQDTLPSSSIVTIEGSFPIRAVSILQPKAFSFCSTFCEPRWSPSCFGDSLTSISGSKEVIFLDTETTGIYKHDRIIEVAFVYRNYKTMMERRWYSLINPQGKKSSKGAFKVHKIPNESLSMQQGFADLIDEITEFIGDSVPLIAHNASFDRMMLNQELIKLRRPLLHKDRFICTYRLAVKLRGRVKGLNSLDKLCRDYNIDSSSRSDYHGAMQDTLLLADLYPFLVVELSSRQAAEVVQNDNA